MSSQLPTSPAVAQPCAGVSLLRLETVIARTGLGRTKIFELVAEDRFPRPIKVPGLRVSSWVSTEIDEWIADTIAAARAGERAKSGLGVQ